VSLDGSCYSAESLLASSGSSTHKQHGETEEEEEERSAAGNRRIRSSGRPVSAHLQEQLAYTTLRRPLSFQAASLHGTATPPSPPPPPPSLLRSQQYYCTLGGRSSLPRVNPSHQNAAASSAAAAGLNRESKI
jgi:hypothetical protein